MLKNSIQNSALSGYQSVKRKTCLKRAMLFSSQTAIRILCLMLVCFFAAAVLTVETHDGKYLASRLPTCIDTTLELATGTEPADTLEKPNSPGCLLALQKLQLHDGNSTVSSILYRGPPSAA
jgi:hypothetical protein